VARVSRPGRPGSVTFNQAAVQQLLNAIKLLIRLSSGFAGLLLGARNSGRAPRSSTRRLPGARPGGYQELDQAVTRSSTRRLPGARPGGYQELACLYVPGPSSLVFVYLATNTRPPSWSELRRAGAWCLVRAPPSWSDQAAEPAPGARSELPGPSSLVLGSGPQLARQKPRARDQGPKNRPGRELRRPWPDFTR